MSMFHPESSAADIPSTPQQAQELYMAVQEYASRRGEPDRRRRDFAFYRNALTSDIDPELMAHQVIPEIPQTAISDTKDELSLAIRDDSPISGSEFQLVAGVMVYRSVTKTNDKAYFGSTYFKVLGKLADNEPMHRLRFSTASDISVPLRIINRAQELLEADPDELALVTDPDVLLEVQHLRDSTKPTEHQHQSAAWGEELRELYKMNRVTFNEADMLVNAVRRATAQLS